MVVLALAVLSLLAATAGRASAADITGSATTTVSVDKTGVPTNPAGDPVYWDWQRITMNVAWSVPNGTTTGDYFTVPLDSDLLGGSFIPFDLTDPASGAVVARATYDASGTVVRFTMTDFVTTHRDVHGTARFALAFDKTSLSQTLPNVRDVYGTRIVINRDPGPNGTSTYKYGYWTPSESAATARDANGALVQRDRPQLGWAVQLKSQVDTPLRDWATLTITETAQPGWHFDCTQDPSGAYSQLTPVVRTYTDGDGPTPIVAVTACSSTSLTLQVTKDLTDRGVYEVRFSAWLDTDDAGRPVYTDDNGNVHAGFSPNGYGNEAVLNYDGWTRTISTELSRTSQSGTGEGDGVSPRIDVEKFTGPWDGVAVRDGIPVLDEQGQPATLPAGDHDSAPGLAVAAGASTPITIRVTNTGTEVLNDVALQDVTEAGPAVEGLVCTFNGSTAMPFNGLQPGDSFVCSGTLPAFTDLHRDRVTVTGVGVETGTAVSDSDAFNATAPAASTPSGGTAGTPGTPPATPAPSPTTTTPSPTQVSPATVGTPISNVQATAPRLRIVKTALSRRAVAGGTVNWRVVVTNVGGVPVRAVRVCDTPRRAVIAARGVKYRLAGAARTARLRVTRGSGCFTVPVLAPGRSVSVVIRTKLAGNALSGSVPNTATATARRVAKVTARAVVRVLPPAGPRVSPAVTG